MSNPRTWMQTYTGRAFKFDECYNLDLHIKDIARPLSRIPRFGGHTTKPLSVAEHSIAVSYILERQGVPSICTMHGLMHDAHEAFTGDMVAPFKRYLKETYLIDINAMQAEMQCNIMASFRIPMLSNINHIELIREADLMACKIERDIYMSSTLSWDIDDIKYSPEFFSLYNEKPLSSADAFKDFTARFNELRGKLC